MVDSNRYQPPGVYVTSQSTPVVTTVGAPATTVTLVGLARGYQVHSEIVPLSSTTITLAKKGIRADVLEGPDLVITKQDGTALIEDVDFVLVRGTGVADPTTIQRKSESTDTVDGELVIASYSYADDSYYAPKSFSDYSSIEAVYGPTLVDEVPQGSGDQVVSPLSLAARLAFENGADTVQCLPVEPPTTGSGAVSLRTRFQQAYAKLVGDYQTTILVPLIAQGSLDDAAYTSGFQGFVNDARTHCQTQSASGYGRIALVGADRGYDESTTSFQTVAQVTASKRVMVMYPTQIEIFNSSLGQTVIVGGVYLAAAAAGRLAASGVSRGLTQQQVSGFVGLPTSVRQSLTQSFKDSLSASGVAVVENSRNNRLVIRHGVSTDVTSLTTREINVTRADDVLLQLVKEGLFSADLIGSPIDSETTIRVKGIITGILETAKADLVIQDYYTLQVRQQSLPSGDPTAIECQFTYGPFLPLNYITTTFAMDLVSGQVAITDEDSAAA